MKPKLQTLVYIEPHFLFDLAKRGKVPEETTMKQLEALHANLKEHVRLEELGGQSADGGREQTAVHLDGLDDARKCLKQVQMLINGLTRRHRKLFTEDAAIPSRAF